jgi:hypothetical protein
MDDSVRSTLTISKGTDTMLRTFLARSGLKKGDLWKFVEDAVHVVGDEFAPDESRLSSR